MIFIDSSVTDGSIRERNKKEGTMNTKVSVIMPSLNVADYIRECMESVIGQTLQEIEIICVDAGSDDGTRQILEEYVKKDSRITIIDSRIKSYGRQVNMGIAAAKGKYVAIVETDDFVLCDMYERLFLLAEQDSLDYIMADFKAFYDDKNEGRVYTDREVFKNTPELYNRILSLHDHAHIYNGGDATLWRGIFLREFLVSKQIRLNETSGAAYQDVCFMNRVRIQARRSMYVNQYGYCYRTDREGSSTNSVKGLQYAKYEYQYLLENDIIPEEYKGKIYYLMSCSLLAESVQILSRQGYLWGKENSKCYEWFRWILAKAIKEKRLKESMDSKEWWKQLNILLDSKEAYTARLKTVSDRLEELKKIIRKASIIIVCGAGTRGRALIKLLKNAEFTKKSGQILCADNDSRLWDTDLNGIKIYSIDTCAERYPEACFVIASKFFCTEIKAQLLLDGVAIGHIYEYNPSVNWD